MYYKANLDNIFKGKTLFNSEKKLFFIYSINHSDRRVSLFSSSDVYDNISEEEFNEMSLYIRLHKEDIRNNVIVDTVEVSGTRDEFYDNMMEVMACSKSRQVFIR